jgi:hypothetical protein
MSVLEKVARVAHAANSELRRQLGEPAIEWEEMDEARRAGVIAAAEAALQHRWIGPYESHSNWVLSLAEQGWSYGPVHDPVAKLHPNMVPYDQLTPEQRQKDALFLAVVRALL